MDEFLKEQVKRLAQADHEILSSASENLRRMRRGIFSTEPTQDFANLKRFITERIERHFSNEEAQLFPVLLADNPTAKTTQLIAELRQEHMLLLERAQLLGTQVERNTPPNSTGHFWTEIMDFFTDLEKHALKEEQLLDKLD